MNPRMQQSGGLPLGVNISLLSSKENEFTQFLFSPQ